MTSVPGASRILPRRKELREGAATFTRWWIRELEALIPATWREQLARAARRLLVDVDGRQARIRLRGVQGTREIAVLDLDVGAAGTPGLETALRDAGKEPIEEVVVRVAEHQALVLSMELPAATEENLREVLAFEMDRQTPFKADQVYYDFVVTRTKQAKGRASLGVVLVLIPRGTIDPLLELLASAGLPATSVTLWGASRAIQGPLRAMELLPSTLRTRASRTNGGRLAHALAYMALALTAVAIALPLVQKRHLVQMLEAQVEEARAEASRAGELRKELEAMLVASNHLAEQRQERRLAISALDELTRIVPDGTWLTSLEVSGFKVKLQGESANASELAGLLLASDLFADAHFDSPVTRVGAEGREQFLISATISGPTGKRK